MYYIYGDERQRKHFTDNNIIPYFRYEDRLDVDCAHLYNDDYRDREDEFSGLPTMVIDLNLGTFTVYVDTENGAAEDVRDFGTYDEALEAYRELEG